MTDLDNLIDKLQNKKKELDSFKLSTEDLLRIAAQFRLDWGDHQNDINKMYNMGATKPVILSGLSEPEAKLKRNIFLFQNNEIAKILSSTFITSNKINQEALTNIHKQIFKNGGILRKTDVYATDWNANISRKFIGQENIETELNKSINWLNDQLGSNEIPPVVISAIFHHQLVNIHPFTDGNGRFARIVSSLILLHYNYPPPSVQSNDREMYINCLHKADLADISPLIKFFTEKTISSIDYILYLIKTNRNG